MEELLNVKFEDTIETQQDDSDSETPTTNKQDIAYDELMPSENHQNQRSNEVQESSNQQDNEESSNLNDENDERFNKNWKQKF